MKKRPRASVFFVILAGITLLRIYNIYQASLGGVVSTVVLPEGHEAPSRQPSNHSSTLSSTSSGSSAKQSPRWTYYFSESLSRTLQERGLNLITPVSGCKVASWVYQGGSRMFRTDCLASDEEPEQYRRKRKWVHTHRDQRSLKALAHAVVSNSTQFKGNTNVQQGLHDQPMQIWRYHPSQRLTAENAHKVQEYDTVYVNIKGLKSFLEYILPMVNTSIILISGQFHIGAIQDMLEEHVQLALLRSPKILKLFIHNMDHYFETNNIVIRRHPKLPPKLHPKLAPWPYGLQHVAYNKFKPNPLPFFRNAFWKHLKNSNNKTHKRKGVMHGYLSLHTNKKRSNIPSGPKLNLSEYYDAIAEHRFVLSPNGDRPECYRHYEALGLGTVPITELDPMLYFHLSPGPILYSTSNWTLDETEAMQRLQESGIQGVPNNDDGDVIVNRLMVLEEYWLEYVERQLDGLRLRWFDRLQGVKTQLDGFHLLG